MDADCRNTVLCCNCPYATFHGSFATDKRTSRSWIEGIEQPYRNIVFACWKYTLGMQDFSAKIGQLRCFIKTKVSNRFSPGHYPWVIVVHSINIRPDLHLFHPQGRSD